MSLLVIYDVEIKAEDNAEFGLLFTNKEAAKGFGCKQDVIRQSKSSHSDELIENKHFIIERNERNQKVTKWTPRGIVRLGFFIKSQQAKQFRDWAEDYIVKQKTKPTNDNALYNLKRENIELKRALNRLTNNAETNPELEKLKTENKNLKNTLILIKHRYHKFVEASEEKTKAVRDELKVVTTLFQTLPSLENDGKNLNTNTETKHIYWD